MWSRLRSGKNDGFKWRRQHPHGPFIADFYCHEAGLVVEIDGWTHSGPRLKEDRARDAWMRQRGIEVVRVSASSVAASLRSVLAMIRKAAEERAAMFRKEVAGQSPPPF